MQATETTTNGSTRPSSPKPSSATQLSAEEWDSFVTAHPRAHILQSSAWGRFKEAFGWTARQVVVLNNEGDPAAGALLLFRRVAGLSLAYVPKGPLTDWQNEELTGRLLGAIHREARRQRAILLKIEPDIPDRAEIRSHLKGFGFRPSPQAVQPRSTVTVDIRADEDEILARMKSKWRYNVRLSGRKDIVVREGTRDDLRHFQDLVETTGERDDFDVHGMEYYRKAFDLFVPEHGVFLFAEYEGEPLASIVVLKMGKRAWYLWGASSNRHRNRMPNHALQWAAIRWAKQQGASHYDLWGIPDEIGQVALGMGSARNQPVSAEDIPVDVRQFPDGDLWGVFRFKQGFGGSVERMVGAWDMPLNHAGYALYRAALAIRERGRLRQFMNGDWKLIGTRFIRQVRDLTSDRSTGSDPGDCRSLIANRRDRHSLQSVTDPQEWRSLLDDLPGPHILQSWEWGEIKARAGWQAERYFLTGNNDAPVAAFQFLWRQPIRMLPVRVAYIPKGPVLDWSDDETVAWVLEEIRKLCLERRCLFIKIDPDVMETASEGRRLLALMRTSGWRFSPEQVQFKNTGVTNLRPDEDDLLADMKSKWRYNIRLAGRRGIEIRMGAEEDLRKFYALYKETSERDGFLIRPFSYYQMVWSVLLAAQKESGNPAGAALFLAEHEEEAAPVAGLFVFRYRDRAWYFYGASSERRRRDMPNHLLQWEAMCWAKEQGCTTYDWWGAPTDLEDQDDPLQGVWRFKEGFNAQYRRQVGAWDWPVATLPWRMYHQAVPVVLKMLQRFSVGEPGSQPLQR